MIFSASQIVGLIEIEAAGDTGSECRVALGREEHTLGELLAWLTGPMARPAVGDDAAQLAAAAAPTNRLAGLVAAGPVSLLDANLQQLEIDLVDAATQFRQSLTAIGAAE